MNGKLVRTEGDKWWLEFAPDTSDDEVVAMQEWFRDQPDPTEGRLIVLPKGIDYEDRRVASRPRGIVTYPSDHERINIVLLIAVSAWGGIAALAAAVVILFAR